MKEGTYLVVAFCYVSSREVTKVNSAKRLKISMEDVLPDLIINSCPQGCDKTCELVWLNDSIWHRIVCNCVCHYKKNKENVAPEQVVGPNARATANQSHPEEFSE